MIEWVNGKNHEYKFQEKMVINIFFDVSNEIYIDTHLKDIKLHFGRFSNSLSFYKNRHQ